MIWRPVDWLALVIADRWSPAWQMRTGVLMVLMSLAYFAYMPFSGEQPGIFSMSAFALLFGGPAVIGTARLAMQQSETDEDLEQLKGGTN